MAAQFQYVRLAHQAQAVDSIADVFADVRFVSPAGVHANPTYLPHEAFRTLRANIERIRQTNQVNAGAVEVASTLTPALSLDVLMETGTGKTFTFIETIHRLHQKYRLSKFIVLVPSSAIRQGTLKSLHTTAAFFAREYDNQKINVVNYSDKTVNRFIHAANLGLTVMVATYQSFAGDGKLINKRGVEANLFGQARSYMEALAAIRPVLIIDEPHRFEGKVVQEFLPRFNPLLTLRFGATFKRDEFRNLIYTLDSLEAFRQRLVKGITVDTVGTGADMEQTLLLTQVTGAAKERTAHLSYQTPAGKTAALTLQAKDNLGAKTGLAHLDGHVVESVTTQELVFTNGFALPLGEPTGFGMLADEVQSLLIQRAIANHFEREEAQYQRGIKAISLFFIDAVAKYLPAPGSGQRPAVLRDTFERLYQVELAKVLASETLDPGYRAYLERTAQDVSRVHKGYFARSNNEKGEEEAIKLILKDKEKLLSFDNDLRFIFSMWALQEGWDNPNVFTLCKLAPSPSKITKLQQIGRGLRLAVNQQLERVQATDAAFDDVNDLVVVVPASEGDFVRAIQAEISERCVRHSHNANLTDCAQVWGTGLETIKAKEPRPWPAIPLCGTRCSLAGPGPEPPSASWLGGTLNTPALVCRVLATLQKDFEVTPLSLGVTRTTGVNTQQPERSAQEHCILNPTSVFSLGHFVRELAKQTGLSMHTISEILRCMPADKFGQIKHNENTAMLALQNLIRRCTDELRVPILQAKPSLPTTAPTGLPNHAPSGNRPRP